MMAEENFSGAELASESSLISALPTYRTELIQIYLEALLYQKKSLPSHLVLEVLNFIILLNEFFR
jgi:hypothetical protein